MVIIGDFHAWQLTHFLLIHVMWSSWIHKTAWDILSFHFLLSLNKHLFIICECCFLLYPPLINPTLDTVYIWGLVRDLFYNWRFRWTESVCILAGKWRRESDSLSRNHQQWRSFLPVLHPHVITGQHNKRYLISINIQQQLFGSAVILIYINFDQH